MPNISYIKEGKGEVILLLHGWGQNKEMMLPLIDNLKDISLVESGNFISTLLANFLRPFGKFCI